MAAKSGSQGGFLPFLPNDNRDLSDAATQRCVALINDDLAQLLREPANSFWDAVKSDESLHACLDSFLRFRRRPFDEAWDPLEGGADALAHLSRRVFMMYLRMVTPGEAGGPNAAQQADLLYNRWLLDVPKLMDLCVLYGPTNPALTARLVRSLFELQPRYCEDVSNLVPLLVGNLEELLGSCKKLAAQVAGGAGELASELAEAARYYTDASLTLRAFVEVFPPAAALLLAPGGGALLNALATVHEQLLPLLAKAASVPQVASQGLAPLSEHGRQRLLASVLAAMWQLLLQGYCTPEGAAGSTSEDAEARGEQLLMLLMALSSPSDAAAHAGGGGASLLQQLNQRHHLGASIANAMQQGLLALDSAQVDYLSALIGGDAHAMLAAAAGGAAAPGGVGTPAPEANGCASSSSAGAGASGSGSARHQTAGPEAAVLASQVSQVKELLPDFGDGFLAAALHACGYNAEALINTLLEGGGPSGVEGLDRQLQSWAPPPAAAAPAAAGAGGSGLTWTGLADAAHAASAAAAAHRPPPPALTPAPTRRNAERRTARVLGAVSTELRSVTHALADELQYEYDDEYDDSFDDLGGLGNDGVCEIEGEDSGRGAEQRAQPAAGPSSSGAGGGGRGFGGFGGGGGRGAGGRQGPRTERRWVLEGRVYNYAKPGAHEVFGQEGVERALAAAQAAEKEIHGLGRGGNVPLAAAPAAGQEEEGGRGGGRGHWRGGRGGGGGAPGRGGGRGFAHKEQHKAAIGNHHRKDRALRKAGPLV